jgi:hypothetical protein
MNLDAHNVEYDHAAKVADVMMRMHGAMKPTDTKIELVNALLTMVAMIGTSHGVSKQEFIGVVTDVVDHAMTTLAAHNPTLQ